METEHTPELRATLIKARDMLDDYTGDMQTIMHFVTNLGMRASMRRGSAKAQTLVKIINGVLDSSEEQA